MVFGGPPYESPERAVTRVLDEFPDWDPELMGNRGRRLLDAIAATDMAQLRIPPISDIGTDTT